jgi:hypothetical protein
VVAFSPVLSNDVTAIAGFDFERAGKHDEKLPPGGRMPVLIEALGHLRQHRALRWQNRGTVDSIAESIGRRIVDRDIDLDKLRPAVGCRGKRTIFIRLSE